MLKSKLFRVNPRYAGDLESNLQQEPWPWVTNI